MKLSSQVIRQEARACDEVKLVQARRMSNAEKFLAGGELFEEACQWTLSGIRNQFPEYDKEQREAELKRRLKMT